MFGKIMEDNVQARELNNDGSYTRVENDNEQVNCQELFFDKAYEQAAGDK